MQKRNSSPFKRRLRQKTTKHYTDRIVPRLDEHRLRLVQMSNSGPRCHVRRDRWGQQVLPTRLSPGLPQTASRLNTRHTLPAMVAVQLEVVSPSIGAAARTSWFNWPAPQFDRSVRPFGIRSTASRIVFESMTSSNRPLHKRGCCMDNPDPTILRDGTTKAQQKSPERLGN